MGDLNALKDKIFESDNCACYIERERILSRLALKFDGYSGEDKYAKILSELLDEVSVPLLEADYFAGRGVEALPDEGMTAPSTLLCATGHMSFDYAKLLSRGLSGILADIQASAAEKGDEASISFAKNAEIVVGAIRRFAKRYSSAAAKIGKCEMAAALEKVPFEPAFDFYSALQSAWIMHFIASSYVESRDYAFGRFDEIMLPYYKKSLEAGKTKAELTELLAGFMVKTNEVAGRTTHNHLSKPVLCQASKQYINIGGEAPNEFSFVVLDAAMMVSMPQPQIVVLLDKDANGAFTDKVFEALSVLTDKMNIYNYRQVVAAAVNKGIPLEVARDFTYSACCTFDLNYRSYRLEYYVPFPQIFVETLHKGEYGSVEEIAEEFKKCLQAHLQDHVNGRQHGYGGDTARREYVLDGIMLTNSALDCRYPCECTTAYNVLNLFCPGVATVGDSLSALDKLVFKEKRYSYGEFAKILKENFEGNEALRQEILSFERFGNDSAADEFSVLAAKVFLDAVDGIENADNYFVVPSLYSLERDNSWKNEVGATPDGRLAGEPFSENQSPSYGADKKGITALLKSVAKLPFDRTFAGGLNLTFSKNMSPEILKSLVTGYFAIGGQHIGISVVDKEVLKKAMETPEKYKSLTVRLYGFSEYFI
ncbi:MAG: hypothetical protein IIX84_07175, partial [Oscillospiraceae bacterium]|nr:hypothetical protein [Oscillospiraceae bacterium]